MIKNIIFDWAGCLIDDLTQNYEAAMYIFEKLNLKKLSLEEFKKTFKLPYMEFYKAYTEASKKEIDTLFIEGLKQASNPKLFPSTKETLGFLKKEEIKMTLLSSHPQEKLLEELKKFDVENYFLDVTGSVHDKTQVIKEHMERNGFSVEETAYVGDMVHDILAGKEAKVTTIAISWGFQSKDKLNAENPDYLINNIKEIKNLI
ncbi:MAG: HAD hydrolase-like protein [Nanoarchaeota archaeon]|nr:HAD hydrolase-like protein [Nanoarchaeota archaeon]MBU4351702.1 HAD hydrolase-like protein [Nanoarchaeota archaeon]MBU4456693.1 HAD hydrolase-like protein [Nanoarchaeota archaeon]